MEKLSRFETDVLLELFAMECIETVKRKGEFLLSVELTEKGIVTVPDDYVPLPTVLVAAENPVMQWLDVSGLPLEMHFVTIDNDLKIAPAGVCECGKELNDATSLLLLPNVEELDEMIPKWVRERNIYVIYYYDVLAKYCRNLQSYVE